MAKPNYSFEKRQRELAKKKKKEEKEKEKAARKAAGLPPMADEPEADDEGGEGNEAAGPANPA
ncbi:hypothetical protein [Rubrivivax rivuli]|uniref:Uncharacterized protein n=1 Tax=Rubrivivax rivuli TaxID=1862385 RepID=A0A437REZ7_9BURK|nr:hypothetical protein [Rubrivivax rivuli]RVU45319.1 hypothetical protein EOE66_14405 [Rubrivivax rivuli]